MKKYITCLSFILALFFSVNTQAKIVLENDKYQTSNGWDIQRIIIDDVPSYCIQPGLMTGTSSYTKSKFLSTYSSLSASKKKQIEKIGNVANYYYHKLKDTKDSNYIKYYYAGQELIWGVISSSNYTFKTNLTTYKNNINKMVDTYNTLPNFNKKTYDIKAGTSIVIEDSNLNDWALLNQSQIEKETGLAFTKSGTKLTVTNPKTNKNIIKKDLNLEKYPTFSKGSNLAYVHTSLQNYVYIKYESVVTSSVSFNTLKGLGNLVGFKVDQDKQPLGNAKFGLYQNNQLIKEAISNGQGNFSFNDVEEGNYQVKEIQAPSNYELNTKVYDVTVNTGETTYINNKEGIVNEIHKGQLDLYKLGKTQPLHHLYDKETETFYEDNEENNLSNDIPLQGVIFSILKDGKEIEQITTNESGYALSSQLPIGKYQVKEITTLPNYLLEEKIYDVEITKDTITTINNEEPIINKLLLGGFSLEKIDEDKQLIPGIVFTLYDVNDNLVGQYITDKKGQIKVDNLLYGKYYLKEEKNSIFIENKETYEFEINGDNVIVDLGKIENTYPRYQIKVSKIDIDSKQGLQGATFNLYLNNEYIESKVSDTNGYVTFDNLREGCYVVEESIPPQGYDLNKTNKKELCIGKAQALSNEGLIFENAKTKYNLLIKKVDDATNIGIENTVFSITDEKGNVIDYTTDLNGLISLDLINGCYRVKEKQAAPNYKLKDIDEEVCINGEGLTKVYKNTRIVNVDTGVISNFKFIGYIIFLITAILYLIKRNTKLFKK